MKNRQLRRPDNGLPTIAEHLELDRYTGVLDVAVIDVLSQVEFLLNRAREIQRQILRVRGVAAARAAQRRTAAIAVQRIAAEMMTESRQLGPVLKHLRRSADALKDVSQGYSSDRRTSRLR